MNISGKNSHKHLIYYLCIIGFFAIFSTTVSKNPVLPLYAGAIGANDAVIGMISAVSPLAGILFSFPIGVLSDKLGRRKLLILSGIIFLLAPLFYIFAVNPLLLILVRFFHGSATAILGPLVGALIADQFGERKGVVMGTYSSSTLIGRTAAPLIGGVILTLFATAPDFTSYHAVYLIAFLAGVPVFLLTFFYQEDRKQNLAKVTLKDFTLSLKTFLKNRQLRSAFGAEMITYFSFGAFETFLPVYLLSQGASAWQTGLIFAVQVLVIAVTKPYFGKRADQKNPLREILIGMIITGVSLGGVALTGNFWLLLVVSAVFGIGISLSTVSTNVYTANVAEKNQLGASMGALSSIMDIGHASGPFVTGIVITFAGYTAGFGLCFILSLLMCVYIFAGGKDHNKLTL